MKEGCSCGAWVHGSKRQVLLWRRAHACLSAPEAPDHVTAGAQVELSHTVPIGFHVQPTNSQDPFEDDEDD